ncbi:MAG TPA: PIG-L deacetylase family protein [Acidimicrobiales bacterium]|nr:PIG-L deacetylase family protein [Acidimicrobiales bacterium]
MTLRPSPPAHQEQRWAPGSVVAVCAHPDDESFGLGGILDAWARRGIPVALLSFTRGEASTLGAGEGALAAVRADELERAAAVLGVGRTTLMDYPDGQLSGQDLPALAAAVEALAVEVRADTLLAFDAGGITGHPDHQRATEAALLAGERLDLPVVAWCLPETVTTTLGAEFGVPFVGRPETEIDLRVAVDRARQRRAIDCHRSQATDNPVMERRLALQDGEEALRFLRR